MTLSLKKTKIILLQVLFISKGYWKLDNFARKRLHPGLTLLVEIFLSTALGETPQHCNPCCQTPVPKS